MKRLLLFLTALGAIATGQAKKVKVTIDGTVWPSQTTLYLIINEDTAHAERLPIVDGKFTMTVEVDRNAFIRVHDWKEWPERSPFVLIPDSRHITIDWNSGSIQGSKLSQKLNAICSEIRRASPEGFHVDVFSDDPRAWREAQEEANRVRNRMLMNQKEIARRHLLENRDNICAVWIAYCFPDLLDGELKALVSHMKPKWAKHPLMKMKKV